MNIPNLISLARLLSVPVLIWAVSDAKMELAFWIFVVAGLSDAVDGFIAKRFDATSELGSFLDPIADKALLVGAYVVLGMKGYLPGWLVILVVWRDLLIVGGAMLYHTMTQNLKMEPLLISKINTVAQIVLAGYALAAAAFGFGHPWIAPALIAAVAATTVLSGGSYVVRWMRKAGIMESER